MDGLFVLAFLFMFISSISTVLKEANKKKQNDELNKKIEDIYKRTMQDNKNKKPNKVKREENVKKIGNLEKHYDEAIRGDYKEMAEDYFSDKSRKLDEYLSRDIKDRLREYKENKEVKLLDEKKDLLSSENYSYDVIEREEENIKFDKENLAKSIVIKEILDKPLALRRINE